jgi:hypothetical protein
MMSNTLAFHGGKSFEVIGEYFLRRICRSNVFIRNCDSMGARFGDRFLRIAVKRCGENSRIAAMLVEATDEHAGELKSARIAIPDR